MCASNSGRIFLPFQQVFKRYYFRSFFLVNFFQNWIVIMCAQFLSNNVLVPSKEPKGLRKAKIDRLSLCVQSKWENRLPKLKPCKGLGNYWATQQRSIGVVHLCKLMWRTIGNRMRHVKIDLFASHCHFKERAFDLFDAFRFRLYRNYVKRIKFDRQSAHEPTQSLYNWQTIR